MTVNAQHAAESGCPSPFQLDRMSGGELAAVERMRMERHVAGCAACERGLVERAVERAQFVPVPRTLARLGARAGGRRWWRRAMAVAVPAVLCAAGVVVMVRK